VNKVDACLVFVSEVSYLIFPVFFIALVASNGSETVQGSWCVIAGLPGTQRMEG